MARPNYRRLQPEERRQRLLERGAELFAVHSYDELSMREIARAAGISKPLLYHYFPSKRAFSRRRWPRPQRSCVHGQNPIRNCRRSTS
jgi:AcrR family transcriptional regulator